MKRSKAEKRLAVLVHNAAFEQAKEDQANEMLSTDAGPRGQTTVEEAERIGKQICDGWARKDPSAVITDVNANGDVVNHLVDLSQ